VELFEEVKGSLTEAGIGFSVARTTTNVGNVI
jgi:hypothetical protein